MTQPTIYFAHPICDYGTQKEADIIAFLEGKGYTVVNPADYQDAFTDWLKGVPLKELGTDASEFPTFDATNKMAFWVTLAQSCDECAFCAFDSDLEAEGVPSGYLDTSDSAFRNRPTIRIGAGVWKEVESFWQANKLTYFMSYRAMIDFETEEDIPPHISIRAAGEWLNCFTLLTVDQTRALLRASGRYDG